MLGLTAFEPLGRLRTDPVCPSASWVPSAVVNTTELLDVDVDQLAGTLPLVAARRFEPKPAELAHPDPRQDPRDRRDSHPKNLSDLGETQTAQRRDRFDAALSSAIRDPQRGRGAIQKTNLALKAVMAHPLARAAHADFPPRRPSSASTADRSRAHKALGACSD
jgi:hypothetical protein